jgi:hypothetical protein
LVNVVEEKAQPPDQGNQRDAGRDGAQDSRGSSAPCPPLLCPLDAGEKLLLLPQGETHTGCSLDEPILFSVRLGHSTALDAGAQMYLDPAAFAVAPVGGAQCQQVANPLALAHRPSPLRSFSSFEDR